MSDNCSHDCGSCSENCASRDMREKLNAKSSVKKVIGVISGKGGVGKSTVTCLLAVTAAKKGLKTAVLDADITGPSVPTAFGLTEKAMSDGEFMYPVVTTKGIDVMSINLLLEDVTSPVVWRGPVLAGAVKQFWTDVVWKDEDVMFVDCPPGTGDVPLTVFQSVPLDGIVIVTTPQDLVTMVVEKAVNMAKMMNIPVLGLVENMSYAVCPKCGEKLDIFGASHVEATAEKFGIGLNVRLPIKSDVAKLFDEGKIEDADVSAVEKFFDGVFASVEQVKR